MKKRVLALILIFVALLSLVLPLTGCRNSENSLSSYAHEKSSYYLDVTLDDKDNSLFGLQTITYYPPADGITELPLQLNANAYAAIAVEEGEEKAAYPKGVNYGGIDVLSAKVNGATVNYGLSGKCNAVLTLPIPSTVHNQRVEIQLVWRIRLANIRHRLGYCDGVYNLGNFYPTVCVYKDGYLTSDLFSLGDPFYNETADFEIRLTVPDEYVVAASGGEGSCFPSDGTKTLHYTVENARDVAFCASKKFALRSSKCGDIRVLYYYVKDKTPKETVDHAAAVLGVFSEKFGSYGYSSFVVAETPFAFGGMEYSGLIYAADDLPRKEFLRVITHETAHQWWYGQVGNDQIREPWLDESLTEFSTAYYYLAEGNQAEYKELNDINYSSYTLYSSVAGKSGDQTKIVGCIEDFNRYSYYYNVYVKGMLMFANLYSIKGECIIEGLRQYADKYRCAIATKTDLISTLEQSAGCDLNGFFDAWLNGKVLLL